MPETATYKCKSCGDPFTARVADRKRGWARFCSKSCKAIRQTQRNGYSPSNYRGSGVSRETYLRHMAEYGGGRSSIITAIMSDSEIAASTARPTPRRRTSNA